MTVSLPFCSSCQDKRFNNPPNPVCTGSVHYRPSQTIPYMEEDNDA